jgi:hypothetical protein
MTQLVCTDLLASNRDVILFEGAGLDRSTGKSPAMAAQRRDYERYHARLWPAGRMTVTGLRSVLGQKRKSQLSGRKSASPPKADIARFHVGEVPL